MKAVCFNGSEAFSRLATQAFDVVVSDFNMPGTFGPKFINKIRQDHSESSPALITSYKMDTLEEEVHRLGTGYVTRPIEMFFVVPFSHDLIGGVETAKTSCEIENTTRMPIPSPKGNAGMR